MGAGFIDWNPPDFRAFMISDSTFRWLCGKLNYMLVKFYEISSGKDFRTFFLAITSLWILSIIGNYFSSLNLLYLGSTNLNSYQKSHLGQKAIYQNRFIARKGMVVQLEGGSRPGIESSRRLSHRVCLGQFEILHDEQTIQFTEYSSEQQRL
ncbi:Reticulon-like protein B14 [Capsicum annuum]